MTDKRQWLSVSAAFIFLSSQNVLAYIGPGAGLAAVGTVLALIGSIALALVAFIWYPVKRMLAKRRKDK